MLGYITIVTTIKKDRTQGLERHLRAIAPKLDPADPDKFIKCARALPFDQLKGLHFCSMLIIRGADEAEPKCLVFEATFDGTREEFLDDLLRVAPEGIQAIYRQCEEYPTSGIEVPWLVKDYLLRHDAGANTFYSGNPGRSVAQILGEGQLRAAIANFIFDRRRSIPPNSLGDLQTELQNKVVRNRPDKRWAEQLSAVPWEITNRANIVRLIKLVGLATAALFGWIVFRIFGHHLHGVHQGIVTCLNSLASGQVRLTLGRECLLPSWSTPLLEAAAKFVDWLSQPLDWLGLPHHLTFIFLIVVWYVWRFLEFLTESEDPRQYGFAHSFLKRYALYLSQIGRTALLVFLIAFGVKLLAHSHTQYSAIGLQSAIWLPFLFIVWLLLKNEEISLQLKVQFKSLASRAEMRRSVTLEFVRFAKMLVVLWSLAIIAPLFLQWIRPSSLYSIASWVYYYSLVALVYTFTGILVGYIIIGLVSLLIRFREYRDSKDFTQATKLISKTDDIPVAVYEREETDINKYQNHLASLTYAKPGFIRSVLLRTALLLVGVLARFWFNVGQLGDIPTILAARWVILRGKETQRLLFVSNYCGSLDNYLNEFIDLSAVIGLNAIWTNTFVNGCSNSLVEKANTKPAYAFPQTKYLFQGGAQAEKPFKAYVRQSQIETLVWYSAYPTLTNRNINANGDLRQALFKPSVASELDEAFLKAGL